MTDAEYALKEALNRVEQLEAAIRHHRDSWLAGDDKCWKDNEELYALLPEGYRPPERDTLCEIANCYKYVRSCHSPGVTYVSPQRRIEELEAENAELLRAADRYRKLIEGMDPAGRPLGGG